ncbi:MAG: galactokinase [Rubrivivax sp.]
MSLQTLRQQAEHAFSAAFGGFPSQCVQAPGRVNLIGEHTDYNDGFVLPCAIDRATVIALRPRADRQVHVLALEAGPGQDAFTLTAPLRKAPEQPWTAYVRGMLNEALAVQPDLPGLDMVITGNVPQGAGLSSSASLEVAVGAALQAVGALAGVDATGLALMAQRAENHFVGCQCGIMDQLVAARAQAGHALLIDCRSLAAQAVHVPQGLAVLIAHSRVRRGLVDSHYNERRRACEAAARDLGVRALRDLTPPQLQGCGLDELTLRRARHVVTENERTQAAAVALAAGDIQQMSRLMAESHASLRDDFEVSVPAVDQLVAIVHSVLGDEGGCRMTGGGFGGCVVALLPQGAVEAVTDAVQTHYRSPEGLPATLFLCHASAGAGLMR